MNRIVLISALFLLPFSWIQSAGNNDGLFLKRIENNYINNITVELPNGKEGGMYNVQSKRGNERLFFGDFNARVEYFIDPSFRPLIGFRIYRDSLDLCYLFEVKTKNRESDAVASYRFRIGDSFADSIYARIVETIDTFTASGKPDMVFDGDRVTFRCVVGAEVWTLTVHQPSGNLKVLSDLFRRMIADVEAGTFDEAKYIEALD